MGSRINKIISLSKTEKYLKYNALKKAGYNTEQNGRNLKLVSDIYKNLDNQFDNTFRDIDDVLMILSDDILRVGYKIVK